MQQNLTPIELVRTIVSTFVQYPDQIEIRALEAEQSTLFELRAHASDTGRIIGKNGRTVRALRDVLLALQSTYKRRFTLEILNSGCGPLANQPQQDAAD
jgi:uncharacterized protein